MFYMSEKNNIQRFSTPQVVLQSAAKSSDLFVKNELPNIDFVSRQQTVQHHYLFHTIVDLYVSKQYVQQSDQRPMMIIPTTILSKFLCSVVETIENKSDFNRVEDILRLLKSSIIQASTSLLNVEILYDTIFDVTSVQQIVSKELN